MRVFLIHIRDPQFYALPAKTRAKNGNIRVMGFPPIGIMSLSAVLTLAIVPPLLTLFTGALEKSGRRMAAKAETKAKRSARKAEGRDLKPAE